MNAAPPGGADAYDDQARGDASSYDRYLAAMDASMRQKVALTAAHLLSSGRVADMGMGSGASSFALASLYPSLTVVGVDVNPEMVQRAAARHQLDNLSFVEGDIAKRCFAPSSLDAILDSSVLHHVTTFNGYDRGAASAALAVQRDQLVAGGILVVRDFLDPGEGEVWLDLRDDDGVAGAATEDPRTCSTAALFERFAREFRILRPDVATRGFPYRALHPLAPSDVPALRPGWRRYACQHRHAVEFILRKDYRESWAVEVQEEYTYLTQPGFERVFAGLGLRVLASTQLRNPWIVANRFEGQLALWRPSGERLDHPPTNYVIVGERAPDWEGVRIAQGRAVAPLGYLKTSHWRRDAGSPGAVSTVYDLVRRPGPTVDVVPWFEDGHGAIAILARRSYPRPIPACDPEGTQSLDGSTAVTYSSEPLNMAVRDKPLAQTAEELVSEFIGIGPDTILAVEAGATYLPSPGGLQEEVRAVHIQVAPFDHTVRRRNTSGFSTSGVLRAIEARQLLRASQVGALPDARLELNVYDLLLRRGRPLGAWIGAEVVVPESAHPVTPTSLSTLLSRPPRRRFRRVGAEDSGGFLAVRATEFVEYSAADTEVARRPLEYVVPATRSFNTVAVACLRRDRGTGQVYLGLDDDDLPAAQCFAGHSQILVTPAWRLPRDVVGERAALAWVAAQLAQTYGLSGAAMVPLGGRYHPSAGVTPEVVYPYALSVTDEDKKDAPHAVHWVALDEVVARRSELREGHLWVAALRAAHALV